MIIKNNGIKYKLEDFVVNPDVELKDLKFVGKNKLEKIVDYVKQLNSFDIKNFNIYGFKFAYKNILKHLELGNDILIYADYDSDGFHSSLIHYTLLNILKEHIGSSSKIKIKYSNRLEGYGIKDEIIDSHLDFFKGYKLLITTDIGITVNFSKLIKQGLDIIVFDHHIPSGKLINGVFYVDPIFYKEENLKTQLLGQLSKTGAFNSIEKVEDYLLDIKTDLENNELLKDNYEFSAGELAFLFMFYVLFKEIKEPKYYNVLKLGSLMSAVTTVTDIMDLKIPINYYLFKKGVINYNKFIDLVNSNGGKLDIENYFYGGELDIKNEQLKKILLNYIKVFYEGTQGKQIGLKQIGYGIGPYFNSYGRMFVPELLLYNTFNGIYDNRLNKLRKNIQEEYLKYIKENVEIGKINIVNMTEIVGGNNNNEKFSNIIQTGLEKMKQELDIIDNFYYIGYNDIGDIQDIPSNIINKKIYNEDGVIGILASKLNENSILSVVGIEKEDGKVYCSGRSKLNFIDEYRQQLYNDFGNDIKINGHNKAFGFIYKKGLEQKIKEKILKEEIIVPINADVLININKYSREQLKELLHFLVKTIGILDIFISFDTTKIKEIEPVIFGNEKKHIKYVLKNKFNNKLNLIKWNTEVSEINGEGEFIIKLEDYEYNQQYDSINIYVGSIYKFNSY